MGISPTKTGEMREDQFWVLKSSYEWAYYDETVERPVEPIIAEPVSLDVYQKGEEELQGIASLHGHRVHGRRINDEVELFEWYYGGQETPGLREALEAKGLTVRTYQPQKKNKFPKPNYRAVVGEDAGCTPLEKCIGALRASIRNLEQDEDIIVHYAILADSGKKDKKIMLVVNFHSTEFYHRVNDEAVRIDGVMYEVLGAVNCDEVQLKCEAQKFMSFFKVNSSNSYHVDVCSYDMGRAHEIAEREAAKAEKKKAKKHRRQITASTVTTRCEISFASQVADDEEAVRERQRDKQKAKKMLQKERRKTRIAEMEEEERETLKIAKENANNHVQDNESGTKWIVVGECGTHCILYNGKGERRVELKSRLHLFNIITSSGQGTAEDSETKTPTPSLGDDEDSSSSRTSTEDGNGSGNAEESTGTGLRVLHVSSVQDIPRAIAELMSARGTVLVGNLE